MSDQVKYTQKLKGDKVLIIGGSSGIGFGVAEACLENGCTVIISSSSEERVAKKVAELQKSYPSAKDHVSGHACNLGDEATLDKNIEALFEKAGTLDHIVFTAGDAIKIKSIGEIDVNFIKQSGMVRFFAPMIIAKHAIKYLTPGPKSSITLTTGTVSERPVSGWTVIGSFATGLQGLTRSLALELKPIRVNLVSPGAVDTELWDHFGLSNEARAGFLEKIGKNSPTGKAGTVEDLAESYLYLLKDRNITGTMISTNSGSLLLGRE